MTGISLSSLQDKCASGKIPAIRVGAHWRIKGKAVLDIIQNQGASPGCPKDLMDTKEHYTISDACAITGLRRAQLEGMVYRGVIESSLDDHTKLRIVPRSELVRIINGDLRRDLKIDRLNQHSAPEANAIDAQENAVRTTDSTNSTAESEMYTISEFVAVTGLTNDAVRGRIKRGQIKSVIVDGTLFVPKSEAGGEYAKNKIIRQPRVNDPNADAIAQLVAEEAQRNHVTPESYLSRVRCRVRQSRAKKEKETV